MVDRLIGQWLMNGWLIGAVWPTRSSAFGCSYRLWVVRTFAMVSLSFDPGSVQSGSRQHVVVQPVAYDASNLEHLVVDCVSKSFYHVEGNFGPEGVSYTLLRVLVFVEGNVPKLVIDADTIVLKHDVPKWSQAYQFIEACSGLGFMGLGGKAIGMMPVMGCDYNGVFSDAYSKMHGIQAVHGDIGCPETVLKLWAKCDGATGIMAGISCQPYSLLGDQGSGLDARSASLPGVLNAIHWLRLPWAILECVAPIANDSYAQSELDAFCEGTGYFRQDIILNLADIWPSKRERWWCVLTAPAVGKVRISPFPSNFGLRKVSELVTSMMDIPMDELEALRLTDHEKEVFGINDGWFV